MSGAGGRSRGSAPLAAGGPRRGLVRPHATFAGLAAGLAVRVRRRRPELIRHARTALAHLLPAFRDWPELAGAPRMRAGLADFAFYGTASSLEEFYWKWDLGSPLAAELTRFLLAAATAAAEEGGGPPVLRVAGEPEDGSVAARHLALLARYAGARGVRLEVEGGEAVAADGTPGGAPGDEVFAAAAVFALPFPGDAVRGLLDGDRAEVESKLAALAARGLLLRLDDEHWSLAAPAAGDAALARLAAPRRRELHHRALALESQDPWAALWHAEEAGVPAEAASACRRGLEAAWAAGDYAAALELARRLGEPAAGEERPNRDLLLALLHYEAGDAARCEEHLARLAKAGGGPLDPVHLDPVLLDRLRGYNAVFGRGDLAAGERMLGRALAGYEARGEVVEAAAVRNSIAFAMVRSGRGEEALALEEQALAALEAAGSDASSVGSILALNLGRLHRNRGGVERAAGFFRRAMDDGSGETSPHLLLVFKSGLARLEMAAGEPGRALSTLGECGELLRDMRGDGVSYPVLDALAATLGRRLAGELLAGDEVAFHLHLTQAVACRQLGLDERARAHLAGVERFAGLVPEAVEEARRMFEGLPVGPGEEAAAEPVASGGAAASLVHPLLRRRAGGGDATMAAAAALAEGATLALFRRRSVAGGAVVFDRLVLWDPRRQDLARRVNAEIGANKSPTARAALALPAAAELVAGSLAATPLIEQEVDLRPEGARELAGLPPIGLRVQVVDRRFDGWLADLVAAFAAAAGVPLLAAAPFHLRGHDLPATAERACAAFLLSSLDLLALDDELVEKVHGAAAAENLDAYRPRLARGTLMLDRLPGHDGDDSVFLVQRMWAYRSCLKLDRRIRPVLDLCTGEASVAEIRARSAEEAIDPRGVGELLRQLWRRGALVFGDPVFADPVFADPVFGDPPAASRGAA